MTVMVWRMNVCYTQPSLIELHKMLMGVMKVVFPFFEINSKSRGNHLRGRKFYMRNDGV